MYFFFISIKCIFKTVFETTLEFQENRYLHVEIERDRQFLNDNMEYFF